MADPAFHLEELDLEPSVEAVVRVPEKLLRTLRVEARVKCSAGMGMYRIEGELAAFLRQVLGGLEAGDEFISVEDHNQ